MIRAAKIEDRLWKETEKGKKHDGEKILIENNVVCCTICTRNYIQKTRILCCIVLWVMMHLPLQKETKT